MTTHQNAKSHTNAKPDPFIQSHRQAPWRGQTQRLVITLVIAILSTSIMWVMLSVTVQAGAAGLEIQYMEEEQEELLRQIANMRTQYAILTSADRMITEAVRMGFEPLKPENITYMVVPSYMGRKSSISVTRSTTSQSERLIKPGYTQSLWEWMQEGIKTISLSEAGILPTTRGDVEP